MLRSRGAEAPQTPPQAQVLRFGNFEQQDGASGFASLPQAAPLVRGLALPIRRLLLAHNPRLSHKYTGLVCTLTAWKLTPEGGP